MQPPSPPAAMFFLVLIHRRGRRGTNPIALNPPSALGRRAIRISSAAAGHSPVLSALSNAADSQRRVSCDKRFRALGWSLSQPSPVSMGKVFAAASRAWTMILGGMMPRSSGHDGSLLSARSPPHICCSSWCLIVHLGLDISRRSSVTNFRSDGLKLFLRQSIQVILLTKLIPVAFC